MFPSLPTGLPTLPFQAGPLRGAVALAAKALPSLFDAQA